LISLFSSNLDIARKIEQYEIVCYASLHTLAAKLRLPAAVKLIRDNLRDEENFLFQLKLQSPRLASERLVPAA
jgi:ferritin-like metal-binding protein YciE